MTDSQSIYKIPEADLYQIDKVVLSSEEAAAALCFRRRDRFVEGSNYEEDLIALLNEFFGNLTVIYDNGLNHQFKLLKTKVEVNNLIGLILNGVNMHSVFINNYMAIGATKNTKLTVASLCRGLLRNHFTQREVLTLAKATGNFDIYYDHVKNAEKDGDIIQPQYSPNKNLIDEFKLDRFQVKTYEASPPRHKKKEFLTQEATRDLDTVFYEN